VTDKLNVARGVSYHRRDLDSQKHADGSEMTKWETERHFRDRDETKRADQTYSNARHKIRTRCLFTDIGYLCPAEHEEELRAAITEAREMCDAFNKSATYCRIEFRVLCTRVEPSNVDGIEILKEALQKHTADIRSSLVEFDYKKARNLLSSTKHAMDILGGEDRYELKRVREEAQALAAEIYNVVKLYDDNVENAIVSAEGQEVLNRAASKWGW
jgi:hypothetical protein